MAESTSTSYRYISRCFYKLAQSYVRRKKPTVIAVAGSVGKTSTKLMLAHMLQTKRVSYMDDSYNNGLGLYLSVFQQKIPTSLRSPFSWIGVFIRSLLLFTRRGPDILILEYGIDHPGDMDDMISFIRPHISILTAVTPEHMEYMKTLDGVADEETKVLIAATKYAVYNNDDIKDRYIPDLKTAYAYGSQPSNAASYTIHTWHKDGAGVDITVQGNQLSDIKVNFISEPLIRQLTGAALVAKLLGVDNDTLRRQLETAQPAASRMRLFEGVHSSTLIDDTTNFSPDAGIEALKALKRLPATRHIAILGNMHELGDYADEGFERVAEEFNDIDILALVGDLSIEKFKPYALARGFSENNNLFLYPSSVTAGIDFRDKLESGDIVLIKGPFGGFYLEEAVKKLLKNQADAKYLTRQSDFWQVKKSKIFGDAYYK